MAERPKLVLAMRPDILDLVLPAPLRARLDALADVHPDLVTDLADPGAARALADARLLLTGWGCPVLDAEALDRMPRLAAAVHAAGSVRHHATPAVWARGIAVSSAADANAAPVVEYTMATIWLASHRALGTAAAYVTGREPVFHLRQGADGATVGVIGASRIGRGVIGRLVGAAAGFQVLLADPYVGAAEADALGATLVGLDDLCRRSDIVTVHAPDLPETRHLLDADRLALLRDGAAVINSARGRLVDTDALARECGTGRIDAYLDVTEPEPLPAGHPLLLLRNVLVTPHIAGCQGSEVQRLGGYAVDEVERWITGQPLRGRVQAADLARIA
ncbi:putative 2-hydroxyacid-family dehydrogenase [Actinacidiphila reveromycinica]|uniref:Putative 2-hydroxyacid-family dehydrogenase n=1 Tax=Actinacidiphila reveromycinica TaxID=659352 RepID=A0A7U3VPY1_9ACTN|nr:hydroxyacid dehydrogenase [Streptomyces sp. SN-593]BBA99144.1 putative 2-hydroxyacid-family dehydrogenase [Streptomyces sp. SN-593]